MIGHDYTGMNQQPFVLLAVLPTFYENIFVDASGKNIYPTHHRKSYEITALRIPEFVFGTHNFNIPKLKIIWHRRAQVTRGPGLWAKGCARWGRLAEELPQNLNPI